jgi:putative transposase
MTKPKHSIHLPGTYFITTQTWQRRPFFSRPAVAEILLRQILHYREEGSYLLHHFVVMPDHFRLLLTLGEETTLERAVQLIKGSTSYRIRHELSHRWPVWQPGFYDHRIRDLLDWEKHTRYIEQNPTKKKLVLHPADYPYGSAGGRYQLDPLPQGLKPTRVGTRMRTG